MKGFARTLLVLAAISSVICGITSFMWNYNFEKNCEDYLKLAGDAPNIQKADEFLGYAVRYLEEKNLTSGNSAYIFDTPKNDVGIWYEQIKGAKDTVAVLLEKPTVSQLEKDNALMKIREVVLDDSGGGTVVTLPDNIIWFPFQWLMGIWTWASLILLLVGVVLTRVTWDDY